MASFNDEGLKKKLEELNMSQQSIQTLSLWLIHHKKHSHTVVNIWYRELLKAPDDRKLTYMYLANDVIQNSKKKGLDYTKEFTNRLPKVFCHLGGVRLSEKSMKGLDRLLTVWQERGVFEEVIVTEFRKVLEKGRSRLVGQKVEKKRESGDVQAAGPHKKKICKEKKLESATSIKTPPAPHQPAIVEAEIGSVLSPTQGSPPRAPPEPEQLIQALQNLENAATSDAVVRETIASLPVEVSDASLLTKLTDAAAGRALAEKVDIALIMLESYNQRLSEEMESRKTLARMLHDFIVHQKDVLAKAEETLEEHKHKLSKVQKVRSELKAHVQNLPDIPKLPNAKAGKLVPLPTAGDLFT